MEQAYALTNPVSLILGKPREDFTRADLLRVVEERRIERITFHYTGLDGKLKELKLPVTSRAQAERVLADGERVDGSSIFKGLVDMSLSDLYVAPVYRSAFFNPFEEGSLDFICRYLTSAGRLAPYAVDTVLHDAHELLVRKTGLALHAMGELEFFLIREAGAGALYPSVRQRGYHASAPFVKTSQILDEMVRHVARITGAVKYAHSEVGAIDYVHSDLGEIKGKQAEQLEIEFLPTPVEEAGDNLVLARWLIRNVAFRCGCVATFAPKLEEGIAGNGMHVHMALVKGERNVMTDARGGLTPEALRLVGGLCAYADSLTAFGNTVSSAYLRLVPNQEAPTRICWSDQNRSAMIRVPLGWAHGGDLARRLNPKEKERFRDEQGRQTIELRSPDGSALVHLLLAGMVMAAEHGLTSRESRRIASRLHVTGNIFQDAQLLRRLPALPRSCVESARILFAKRALYERGGVFPPSIVDYVGKMLVEEDDEFINQKLADLPADDRLHETRRIMHRGLHRH